MEKSFWNPLSFITLMSALIYLGWYFNKYSKKESILVPNWLKTLAFSSSISFVFVGILGFSVILFYYLTLL